MSTQPPIPNAPSGPGPGGASEVRGVGVAKPGQPESTDHDASDDAKPPQAKRRKKH